MSKFTCLMLCVVVISLSNFYVRASTPTFRDILVPVSKDCFKEYPKDSIDVVNRAAETGNPDLLDPCFSGCVFKKAGFINDKGEYDTNSALINLRKLVKDDEQYAELAEVTKQCTSATIDEPLNDAILATRYLLLKDTVSDGEAGCERGARLSACYLQQRHHVSI